MVFKNNKFGVAFISGILMGLTVAPTGLWPLAWIALVPLWVLLVHSIQKGKAFSLSLIWGIGYNGLALFWITGIHPMTWLGVPWWPSLAITAICWILITLWGAALVGIWGWLFLMQEEGRRKKGEGKGEKLAAIKQFRYRQFPFYFQLCSRVLMGTAVWCSLDSLWSAGPLWWTSLSYTQSPHNLAILQLGQLSGPNTITAAIVAVNGFIAEAWIAGRRRKPEGKRETEENCISSSYFLKVCEGKFSFFRGDFNRSLLLYLFPFSLTIALHLFGFILYQKPLDIIPENALKIGIIQGNIPNEIKLNSVGWRQALEGYTAGYKILADQGVDAVLTPETALPFLWTEQNVKYSSFYQAILAKGIVAWVGTFGLKGERITNSLFTLKSQGEIISRYDKVKLVPLGEYIPFENILGGIINRLSPLEARLAAGKPHQKFETPWGLAIVGICYDSAFSEHFRWQASVGGQFILTASNDAHYTAAMMAQHQAQDIMRAIETNRWTVRATNTGYSAIIDPRGRTLWLSKINTYELHSATVYRQQTQTLYVQLGDWLMPVLLSFSLILMGVSRWVPRHNDSGV